MREDKITQASIIREFFHGHPQQDIPVSQVVDWAKDEWGKRTASQFYHPDGVLRSLFKKGYLTRPKRGYYRYEPRQAKNNKLQQLSTKQRKEILIRDKNRCIVCGIGPKEGKDIYVVNFYKEEYSSSGHKIDSKDAVTLCGSHKNIWLAIKKKPPIHNSKEFFVNAYHQAVNQSDTKTINFCIDIMKVYKKHGIDDQIKKDK